MKIIRFETISSTQDEVEKYIGCGEDVIVFAKEQTGGKGTKGRSFISTRGGLYFSYLKNYENFKAEDAHKIIENASIAVCFALNDLGVEAKIKWPNDILSHGKKICGILTRGFIESGFIRYSVTGIGVNVNNEISPGLKDIAVSVKEITGRAADEEALFQKILKNLEKKSDRNIYKELSCVIGKRIAVSCGDNEYETTAIDVLADGRLKTADGKLLSGEEIRLL
ncbi:MAG: biotin--[acetyl-CoA-carboxylase] ligase [Clostridia bacterium]|nr:biotin--[acetyl-CoA-carboxylase] ligase [Clostridia bacterium]